MRITAGKTKPQHIPFSKIVEQLQAAPGEWITISPCTPADHDLIRRELINHISDSHGTTWTDIWLPDFRLQYESQHETQLSIRFVPLAEAELAAKLETAELKLKQAEEDAVTRKAMCDRSVDTMCEALHDQLSEHSEYRRKTDAEIVELLDLLEAAKGEVDRYKGDIRTLVSSPWYVRLFFSERSLPADLQ